MPTQISRPSVGGGKAILVISHRLLATAAIAHFILLGGTACTTREGEAAPRSTKFPTIAANGIGCPAVAQAPAPLPNAAATEGTAPVTVFNNVSLIAMTGAPVQHGMTVIVRGGRIDSVGGDLATPAGAVTIDGTGKWLMPGLVDAHAHLTNIRSIDEPLLAIALANGVTSEIEMGGSGQPNPTERLRMRDEVVAGSLVGPTLYVASPKLNDEKLSRADGIRLVDEYKAQGYDLIKVYNRLSRDGYRGVMLRSSQVGIPIVGHVVREIGLEGALGSGQHGIAHLEEYFSYLGFRVSETETDPTSLLDRGAIPYLANRTREAGVFVSPTLVTFGRILEQVEDLDRVLAQPAVQYVPGPLFSGDWPREVNPYVRNFSSPEHRRNLAAAVQYLAELTKAFGDAGVPLLAGSDAPIPAVVPGFGLHDELERLVAAGLHPPDVLTAATCTAALYLNKTDFGVVAPGRRADLLMLSANPLLDIRNTRAITGVMARGRWLDKTMLDSLLEANLRKEPARPAAR